MLSLAFLFHGESLLWRGVSQFRKVSLLPNYRLEISGAVALIKSALARKA
jgi:hypothetical protein